jgi:hypothetical protein
MKRAALALSLAGILIGLVGCASHRGCAGDSCGGCAGCLGHGGHGGRRGGPDASSMVENSGPATGAVTYPYYTVRGPRDFLDRDPQPIGP